MLESMAIIRSKDYNDSFLYAKIKDVVDLVLQGFHTPMVAGYIKEKQIALSFCLTNYWLK